ncbi:MFS transporter [Jeotgalibacillus sp. ET6]|uniref:MFS transporter n=1 Tax=Jeotgalibacillus sp. ET6 TaxID=3037260 RepID=UPI002418AC0D|nr:MFS transporter [Jeotgalibacillus sp. ET6]MDG5471444.1 MFS transporter [Jeotgalibacillus sp. ET6]
MLTKEFYLFAAARNFLVIGDIGYVMVITFYIFQETGSAAYAALFPFLNTIGSLMAGFIAPLVINRFGNRKIMFFLPLIKAIVMSVFILFFIFTGVNILLLFLIVLVLAFMEGLVRPLYHSSIPLLAPEELLPKANGILSVTFQLSQIAAYSITGIIVASIGVGNTFYIVIAFMWTAVIQMGIIASKIKEFEQVIDDEKNTKWNEMKAGWILLWQNKKIRLVTMMDIGEGIAGSVWIGAITLIFVSEALDKGAEWWGYINSAYYIGALIGGACAIAAYKFVERHLILNIALGSMAYSILAIVYSFIDQAVMALILVLLMGPVYQVRDISQQTLMQKSARPEDLSKVYAAHSVILSATMGFSVVLIGLIADVFGIRIVYLLAGVIVLLTSSFSLLFMVGNNRSRNKIA